MSDGPGNFDRDREITARRAREREERIQAILKHSRELIACWNGGSILG
jgi:hypothetical protein